MREEQVILAALGEAGFAFPVAIHEGHDPDLGDVVEAHAFDVPEEDVVAIALALTRIVRRSPLRRTPLVGAFDVVESAEQRARLPAAVTWHAAPASREAPAARAPHPVVAVAWTVWMQARDVGMRWQPEPATMLGRRFEMEPTTVAWQLSPLEGDELFLLTSTYSLAS